MGEPAREDAARLSTSRDAAGRRRAAAGQADRHHPYPYGFIRRTTEEGLYCIGDQAAVIPSFTGDGISIALHTARCAVAAYLAAEAGPLFQAKLRSGLLAQMRLAEFAASGLNNALARAVLPFCLRLWPGVMRVTAKLTRVAQHASVAAHAAAS